MTDMLLSEDGVRQLREALLRTGYTAKGIADRLGPDATAAVGRNDFRAALRVTEERDPLATLIRLFVCGQTEAEKDVSAALPAIGTLLDAGILERDGARLRQGVDLEPYGDDWWIVSDVPARPGRPLPADHVLGVGGASTTLAAATMRRRVGTALDLGTGCGIQALHLHEHAAHVTATDLSERALRFAATTAALNGQSWELLRGDMTEPVRGRRFDLVVSNPPFVVGPGVATHTYRDSGRPGDAICAELAERAPSLLNEGGTMQFLANWAHVSGEEWEERVAGWLAGTGLDAWVIQREVADPMAYVDLWLADASDGGDPHRKAAWLDWFDAQRIEAVGFGLISLRHTGAADPVLRVEDLRQTVEGTLGERVRDWFGRQDWLRAHDRAGLLAARYRLAEGTQLLQEATMGEEGWLVDRQVLRMTHDLRWSEEVDPLVLALVSGADGRVPLREQLSVLAMAHDTPEEDLVDAALPLIGHLVERGLVIPA